MTEPGLSVIVPCKGRVTELRALLTSLAEARTMCTEPVEVIVVDDSGPADARRHLAHCAAFDTRYVRGPRHVGAKRNVGVRLAKHDLLYFIDSDCQATPHLLQRHVKAHRADTPGTVAVAGPTVLADADTTFYRIMRRSRLLNEAFEWPRYCERVAWATTSNLSVRRSAFTAVGGFAGRPLTVVGGEDVDLCLRLTGAGGTIACDPEAVVVHDAGSTASLGRVSRRLVNYGRSGQWLLSVHPRRGRPKLNRVGVLAVLAVLSAHRRGRGALLLPAVASLLLARDVRDRLRGDDPLRVTALAEATACAAVDWCFDVGEFVAAWQLGRPHRIFSGFRWLDDPAFVWRRDAAGPRRYGG
jgi:GT2 family glycosyltransferase